MGHLVDKDRALNLTQIYSIIMVKLEFEPKVPRTPVFLLPNKKVMFKLFYKIDEYTVYT